MVGATHKYVLLTWIPRVNHAPFITTSEIPKKIFLITTKLMATYLITLVALLMALFRSTTSTNIHPKDQDLRIAIEEMQKANYFTFVMLINMSPLDRKFLGNITFLMPTDRMLSKTIIPQNAVSSFLHRHSVPSPLLFEHLQYIPTGSILPSSMPEYMLNVSNGGGRRSFFLNNVRIITPNICTVGSSIRCHGIDGVLLPTLMPEHNTTSPSPSCSSSSIAPVAGATSPALSLPSPTAIAAAPSPTQPNSSPQKPGPSPLLSYGGTFKFLVTSLMVLIVGSI